MSFIAGKYDVAVIGAGHAGCEAALAAARLGMKTLIFSITLECVANMPCNPHIGGSSKGHLVREIDALGGEMGKNIDKTMIQVKMLNTSKGPAVHSLRAQADRKRYQMEMKHTLEKQENLFLKQGEIVNIQVEDGKVKAVETDMGAIYEVDSVMLATGTDLKGKIYILLREEHECKCRARQARRKTLRRFVFANRPFSHARTHALIFLTIFRTYRFPLFRPKRLSRRERCAASRSRIRPLYLYSR